MRLICLLCASLLFLAVAKLPLGYYNFLRIAITFGALYIVIREIKQRINLWVIFFGCLLVLFNPIFPIYLYKKNLWIPFDIIGGILFVSYYLKKK